MPRVSSSRQGGPFQIGILLLLYQLLAQIGIYTLPPVTLGLIALQTGLFLGLVDLGWGGPAALCLQARAVLDRQELQRVFLAPLLHGNDLHLYYNMVSFAYKGRALERRVGSAQFAITLGVLAALCGAFYVGLAVIAAGKSSETDLLGDHFALDRLGFAVYKQNDHPVFLGTCYHGKLLVMNLMI